MAFWTVAWIVGIVLAGGPPGRTRWVLAGGGADPSSTQASLEEHLKRALEIAKSRNRGVFPGTLLFEAGEEPWPVVQIERPAPPADPLREGLERVFGGREPGGVTYRKPDFPPGVLKGEATAKTLIQALSGESKEAGVRGRVIAYFTGHGSPPREGEGEEDALLDLYADTTIGVAELAKTLDRMDGDRSLILLFAQCYAGAFSAIAFKGGDPRGAAARNRCGFFATLGDREAAGCTAEPPGPGTDDYSMEFFRALAGEPGGDLDGDGKVSMAEAHAWARIHDPRFDVPTSTSERWIRERSPWKPADERVLDGAFEGIDQAARPVERSVLEALRNRLLPKSERPYPDAQAEIRRLREQQEKLSAGYDRLSQDREDLRERIEVALRTRWPVVADPYHPDYAALLDHDGGAIAAFLGGSADMKRLIDTDRRLWDLEDERTALRERLAPWERFARTAETAVREAVLRARAPQGDVEALDRFLSCESTVP